MPLVRTRQPNARVACAAGRHALIIEDFKVCRCGKWICPSCTPSEILWELSACDEHCGIQALLALQRRADGLSAAALDNEINVARALERAAA